MTAKIVPLAAPRPRTPASQTLCRAAAALMRGPRGEPKHHRVARAALAQTYWTLAEDELTDEAKLERLLEAVVDCRRVLAG